MTLRINVPKDQVPAAQRTTTSIGQTRELFQRHEVQPGAVVGIGRSADELATHGATLIIPLASSTVSRAHALIWWEGGFWYVKDLSSTNGSMLNNDRLASEQPFMLRRDAELKVGMVRLLLQVI